MVQVEGGKVLSMPLEDMEKTKREIASSDDNNLNPKVTDIGYLYLSQQINNLMQMQNEFRNNMEIRFDNLRQELKSEIKALSDKTDARFEAQAKSFNQRFETQAKIVNEKFESLEKSIDEKFDKVDMKFDKIDAKFDKIDERFEKIDEKFDEMHRKLKIETNGLQRWAFGLLITIILGFVGTILFK